MKNTKIVSCILAFLLIIASPAVSYIVINKGSNGENTTDILNISTNELQEPTHGGYNSKAISPVDKANDLVSKSDAEREMQTELDFYLPETKRILVYWKNNSNYSLTFGDSWYLEKHNGIEWERIGSESAFYSIGYTLNPAAVRKHVYQVTDYADLLSEGVYRIVTPYIYNKDIPITSDEQYFVTAGFTVTNDKSKIRRSELDYDNSDNSKDITTSELEQETSVRIYKDKRSFDTTVVIDGEKYEIGAGEGYWGVVDISLYKADNRKYLIYTYSRSTDTIISRVAVFDLLTSEDIFVSEPFSGFDLCIGEKPLEGTVFTVSSSEHWESSEDMSNYGSIIDTIGYLIYENGKFKLQEINQHFLRKKSRKPLFP